MVVLSCAVSVAVDDTVVVMVMIWSRIVTRARAGFGVFVCGRHLGSLEDN